MRTLRFALVAAAMSLCVHCGETRDSDAAVRSSDAGESGTRVATDASGSRDSKESDATSGDAAVDGPGMDAEGGDASIVCGTGTCDAGQVCVTFSGSRGGP